MHDQYSKNSGLAPSCGQSITAPQALTLKERLENQKFHAETNLANINAALAALENNPGVEECITALSKVGGIY